MTLDEKIQNKLDSYGFTLDDLTSEEIEMLKEEIHAEDNGAIIIDGVLFNIPVYRKKQ